MINGKSKKWKTYLREDMKGKKKRLYFSKCQADFYHINNSIDMREKYSSKSKGHFLKIQLLQMFEVTSFKYIIIDFFFLLVKSFKCTGRFDAIIT